MKFRLASPVQPLLSPPVGIEHSRRTQRKLSQEVRQIPRLRRLDRQFHQLVRVAGLRQRKLRPPALWGGIAATFLRLFCAWTRGKQLASQVARRSPSSTLPGSLKVSPIACPHLVAKSLYRRRSFILSSSQPETSA